MFNGPLFIVGMPRSGTKLLMHILNNHKKIYIVAETEFLPYYIKNIHKYGDLSEKENFHQFYLDISKSQYLLKFNKNNLIPEDIWYDLCDNYSLVDVYEKLLRFNTNSMSKPDTIWGDKSPSYTNFVQLLSENIPESRFIHIVRDVRDCALSAKKAWGKNIYRYTQRWHDAILIINRDSHYLSRNRYFELKYEELISDPILLLKKICNFIEVDYINTMLEFTKPTENTGDAKGLIKIKSNNKYKYKNELPKEINNKIERIAADSLALHGYETGYAHSLDRVSKARMYFYQTIDAFNMLFPTLKNEGITQLIPSLKQHYYHLIKSRS